MSNANTNNDITKNTNTVLIVNAGGSSVRLSVYGYSNTNNTTSIHHVKSVHISCNESREYDPESILNNFSKENSFPEFECIFHRFVHGGPRFRDPIILNKDIFKELEKLNEFDSLHNPIALKWINIAKKIFCKSIHIILFDTQFYKDLPQLASIYAIPYEWTINYGIYRYGFHGYAHKAMLKYIQKNFNKHSRVITIQLGSGCSITAIHNGLPIDTSMGFTPLEGLIMSTRSGDIDTAIIPYLKNKLNISSTQLIEKLYNESGLLGISGETKDVKKLEKSKSERANLALDLFVYRIVKYIGAYITILGGIDCICFGGGIGENSSLIRANITQYLKYFGVELDENLNKSTIQGKSGCITKSNSSKNNNISVWVIAVDEAEIMVEAGLKLLNSKDKTTTIPSKL